MFWNRLTLAPLSKQDHQKPVFIGFQQDVTERRQIEEKYREHVDVLSDINDTMPGVTFEFLRYPDETYSIAHLSGGFAELSGLDTSQAKADFDRVLQVVHPNDRNQLIQSIEESASTMTRWSNEFRFVHPDGEVTWVMGSSIPQKLENGVVSWRGLLIDITERKELEQDLKEQIMERERINELKSDLFARASHDLRTPLNTILGLSSIIEEKDVDPETQRHLKAIKNAGQSMKYLVDDILDLDRIERGNFELHPQPVQVRELLYDVMSMFRPRIKNSDVTISEIISEQVPDWVVVDAERLQRILINLVGNALKFTVSGRIDVRVECVDQSDDQATLRMSVSDTGPGISDEKQNEIFDDRNQGSAPEHITSSGAGLGLSICQYLVHQMNGEIDVESEVGEGATFSFTVNVGRPEPDDLSDAQDVPVSVEGADVLVVDDNDSMQKLIGRILEDAGVNVTTRTCGQETLDLFGEVPGDRFDAVFIDRRMKPISGLEAIKQLQKQEDGPDAERIYVLTGDPEKDVLSQVSEESIAGVVQKPVAESELLDAIRHTRSARHVETIEEQLRTTLQAKSLQVMVVDDEPGTEHVVKNYLEPAVDELQTARMAQEAIQNRFEHNPNMIVMDLELPGMDGLEATEEIRNREEQEERKPVPIVITTGYPLDEVQEGHQEAGVNRFLNKPVDQEELYRALLDALA